MLERTVLEYLSLADHFLDTHFSGAPYTTDQLCNELLSCAGDYRPAYWRRLKRALSIKQLEVRNDEAASIIAKLQNPSTCVDTTIHKKQKQRRVKSVSPEDHEKLIAHLKRVEDLPCLAAVMAVHITGCRPAEIPKITLHENNIVSIISVKKIDHVRGCDRQLKLSNRAFKTLALLLPYLEHDKPSKTSDISRIQRRLERHVKKLWPQRKRQLSLYSYRHQMGSNLKKSLFKASEIAEIMGHRNIESIDVYGDSRLSDQRFRIEIQSICPNDMPTNADQFEGTSNQ